MEVTGQVWSELWISSSAVDTDFTATLIDQYPPTPDYPDGYAMNLETGIVRARFRSFMQPGQRFHRVYGIKEEPLQPDAVYPVTIDLWGVSYVFRTGHKIRLDISSSSFPRFDANPNTGEPFAARKRPPVVARNTIYLGSEHPSNIALPIR
jgi:putative CocE/NonD family hydrolase